MSSFYQLLPVAVFDFCKSLFLKNHQQSVSYHPPEIKSSLSSLCLSCSHSCRHGTQVAQGPLSACQTSRLGASLGHSLFCQTAQTLPDHKVLTQTETEWCYLTETTHILLVLASEITVVFFSSFIKSLLIHSVCSLANRVLSLCLSTGHPNMGGPMRMNPPRGMGGMGPQVAIEKTPPNC